MPTSSGSRSTAPDCDGSIDRQRPRLHRHRSARRRRPGERRCCGSSASAPSRSGIRTGGAVELRTSVGQDDDVDRSCRGHARSGLGVADRGGLDGVGRDLAGLRRARTGSPTTSSSCPNGWTLDGRRVGHPRRRSNRPARSASATIRRRSSAPGRCVTNSPVGPPEGAGRRRAGRRMRHGCVVRSWPPCRVPDRRAGDRHLRRRCGGDRRQRAAQRGGRRSSRSTTRRCTTIDGDLRRRRGQHPRSGAGRVGCRPAPTSPRRAGVLIVSGILADAHDHVIDALAPMVVVTTRGCAGRTGAPPSRLSALHGREDARSRRASAGSARRRCAVVARPPARIAHRLASSSASPAASRAASAPQNASPAPVVSMGSTWIAAMSECVDGRPSSGGRDLDTRRPHR